ncbi:hypothetical protein DBR37_16445 [Herminiimonas sp. KBW02]|uniref:hypothetical protein n=1 Tax=Herminiimonas sp. KBW02 TaxID=2153363 RepID=UPI000F594809|nr:hypothetical protein [Herminiimonas sp. KBW02]RQO32884.1 hypothetical protein DBR37_16445 [Herminiimonas sp. KBW02]
MRIQTFLLSCALALVTLTAQAFDRPFPDTVKRGVMTPANYPAIIIDEKTRTLSAGARIWNQDNMIEMPSALRGSDFAVNYTESDTGDIDRIWILTADEAKKTLPLLPVKPAPVKPLPAPVSTTK